MEPTLRYWYRQMDIQLDSILSTTVSDLEVRRGPCTRDLSLPLGLAHSQAPARPPQPGPGSLLGCTGMACRDQAPSPQEDGCIISYPTLQRAAADQQRPAVRDPSPCRPSSPFICMVGLLANPAANEPCAGTARPPAPPQSPTPSQHQLGVLGHHVLLHELQEERAHDVRVVLQLPVQSHRQQRCKVDLGAGRELALVLQGVDELCGGGSVSQGPAPPLRAQSPPKTHLPKPSLRPRPAPPPPRRGPLTLTRKDLLLSRLENW